MAYFRQRQSDAGSLMRPADRLHPMEALADEMDIWAYTYK